MSVLINRSGKIFGFRFQAIVENIEGCLCRLSFIYIAQKQGGNMNAQRRE